MGDPKEFKPLFNQQIVRFCCAGCPGRLGHRYKCTNYDEDFQFLGHDAVACKQCLEEFPSDEVIVDG